MQQLQKPLLLAGLGGPGGTQTMASGTGRSKARVNKARLCGSHCSEASRGSGVGGVRFVRDCSGLQGLHRGKMRNRCQASDVPGATTYEFGDWRS